MTEKKIDFKVDYSKLNIISEHNTKEPRYPMVLSVPHSGRVFPQEFLDRVDVSLNELRSNEDPFVDELVMEASNLGIPMVALNIGRAFIDVNRDAIEIDPAMFYNYPEQEMMIGNKRCRVGLGLFHRITAGRKNIYDGLLNYHEAEERIQNVYNPYHAHLQKLIDRTAKNSASVWCSTATQCRQKSATSCRTTGRSSSASALCLNKAARARCTSSSCSI